MLPAISAMPVSPDCISIVHSPIDRQVTTPAVAAFDALGFYGNFFIIIHDESLQFVFPAFFWPELVVFNVLVRTVGVYPRIAPSPDTMMHSK